MRRTQYCYESICFKKPVTCKKYYGDNWCQKSDNTWVSELNKLSFFFQDDGVIVFAIGVGGKADNDELTAIASEPAEKYLIQVGNYER